MSWLRTAMNKAAEVGGKNNITRTVKNYAGTVVQQAGQAVAEGAKIFQDRIAVLFYDPDNGAEPMNFRDVFLHSQALENIAMSMVKRDELLQFARVAITGLKLNAEMARIDSEVSDLQHQVLEKQLLNTGKDDLASVPKRTSEELSPATIEVGKLRLLAESLASSTTKVEKRIADNSSSIYLSRANKDALEEANMQFLQFVIANLSTYKDVLPLLLKQIKAFTENIRGLSNKRSQVDTEIESDVSILSQEKRKIEEQYLEAESQVSTIFVTIDNMKEEFYARQRSSFRNVEVEGKALESFDMIDQIKQEFQAIQRPPLELETLTPKADILSSANKPLEDLTDDKQASHTGGNIEQSSRSVHKHDTDVKLSEGFLDPEAELAKLESEFGKTSEEYSSQEMGGWEFDELEEELRSSGISKDP